MMADHTLTFLSPETQPGIYIALLEAGSADIYYVVVAAEITVDRERYRA